MDSVRSLALDLELPERTVRRAAAEGLIRGERAGPRGYRTTLREREYLRRHWALLSTLREALRTEPNVAFAGLYGSFATGAEMGASDLDLVVALRKDDLQRLSELSDRLATTVAPDVQVVRLEDAEHSPALLLDIIVEGRVLVDREDVWERLQRRKRELIQAVGKEPSLDGIAAEIGTAE